MKKRFCGLLAVLFLALAVFPASALAGEPVSSALSLSCSWNGDALTVFVGVEGDAGIAGFDAALSYDADALTFSNVALHEAWGTDRTFYAADCGEGTVKVVSVRDADYMSGELFSVTFTASGLAPVHFAVSGSASSWDETAVALTPAELTAVQDVFRFTAEGETQLSGSTVTGSVTAKITSFGDAYAGDATVILSCYQNGRFCGCKLQPVRIEENKAADVTLSGLSFPLPGSGVPMLRLMLVSPRFAPLAAPVEITAEN